MGAAASLFILLVALSGVLISFSGPLMGWETGAYAVSSPRPEGSSADLSEMIAAAKAEAGPGFIPLGYLGPHAEIVTEAEMVYGLSAPPDEGGEVEIVAFDPGTGETTGTFLLDRTLTHGLIDFHTSLLAGPAGAVLVAIVGLLMSLLAALGLWLWLPRTLSQVRGKALSFRAARKLLRQSLSIHSLAGFWLGAAVILWGLSGTYWSKPDWFASAQTDRAGTDLPQAFESEGCGESVSASEAAALALSLHPGKTLLEAEFAAPWQPYHVLYLTKEGAIDRDDGDTRVWVHAACEAISYTVSNGGAGHAAGLAKAFHSGRLFGPLRTVVVGLLGVGLVLLSVTGLHLWWVKTASPMIAASRARRGSR
nr:PepSY-associated TM helix domain-containing protein [Parvularcula maris]